MFNSIIYVRVYSIQTLRPRVVESVSELVVGEVELELGTQSADLGILITIST